MNIEQELKKINEVKLKTDFKDNLRKRLLNDYEVLLLERKIDEIRTESKINSFFNKFFKVLKYQSALNFSILFVFSFSAIALGSYIALPQDIKDNIKQAFVKDATLEVVSNIAGADVFLNGEPIGKTPLDYTLKEGNYSLRVEKEGYVVYSTSFDAKADGNNVISAELIEDVSRENVYAGWLKYENVDLGVSFMYPNDWNIRELFEDERKLRNFQVTLSKGGNFLDFIFNSQSGFELDRTANISTYKREMDFDSKEGSRYIQFKENGDFSKGGFEILADDNRRIVVQYHLSGTEATILKSDLLKTMDTISQSMVIGDSYYVVAFNDAQSTEENLNEKVELVTNEENVVEEVGSVDVVASPEPGALTNKYTNEVYGYQIDYPSSWVISDTRANYPLNERSHQILIDGVSYDFARLKFRTRDIGSLFIVMTNEYFPIEKLDACATPDPIGEIENYKVVRAKSTFSDDFGNQICKDGKGVNEYNSGKNGSVKYVVFWSIERGDMDATLLQEMKNVLNSFASSESNIKYKIEDISYKFSNHELGVTLNYPYNWSYEKQDFACGNLQCVKVLFKNRNNEVVLEFSNDTLNKTIEGGFETRNINGKDFKEYFEKNCVNTPEGEKCEKGNFKYASYVHSNGIEVRYFKGYDASQDLKNVLGSVEM